jgi:acetyl esterase
MDPELAAVAEMLPSFDLSDMAATRELFGALLAATPPRDYAGVELTEREIPGPYGAPAIPVRILSPATGANDGPGVLDIHGGGMVFGTPAMDDGVNVAIVREVGAVVVSVDYRLAPEHPFPAGLDDCYAALNWVVANAAELGIDPARLAVIGDSGGGNLAAATALTSRDRGGPTPAMLALLEPVTDDRMDSGSMTTIGATSLIWNNANAADSWRHYLDGDEATGYAAPARMEDLSGLPPVYLTVNELDPLRDEGLAFAQRLLGAGVSTELHCWPGAFHGFGLVDTAAISQRAVAALCGALSRGL